MTRYRVMRYFSNHDKVYKWAVYDLENANTIVFCGSSVECGRECKRLNKTEESQAGTR